MVNKPEVTEREGRSPSPRAPASKLASIALGAGCVVFAATMLTKLRGGDVWWHLRSGQWILEHGAIPTEDPFSHTAAGPWHNTEVLAQVLYALADRIAGIDGICWLHALLGLWLAALVTALTRRSAAAAVVELGDDGPTFGATVLVVGLWAMSSFAAMPVKPQMYTYLAFTALLMLLQAAERERVERLWWAVPLMWLWGNLHRGGVLGLAALGATALVWIVDRRRRRRGRVVLAVLLLSAVALLLNPAGWFYLASAFDLASRRSFQELLSDWRPMSLELLVAHHLALVPLALAWLAALLRRGRRAIDHELLIVLGTALLAWHSVRFVPLVAIAMCPGAVRALLMLLARGRAVRRWVRPTVTHTMLTALGVVLIVWKYAIGVPVAYWGTGALSQALPVDLTAFLANNPPPGKMWNSFDLGGYLLYALAPQQPVFIDGRNDAVYSEAFFRDTIAAQTDPQVFQRQVQQFDVSYAVVAWYDPDDPRMAFLHADPNWSLVYWDDSGAVLVRHRPQTAAYIDEHGYRELRVDTAFPRVFQLGQSPRDRALAEEVLRNAAQAPHSLRARYLEAVVYQRRGDMARYAATKHIVDEMAARREIDLRLP